MQAVVLAGGLGTRLGEHARDVPKSLIEVAGRPFVEWQLERIARAGFARVLFCVGHLGERIRAHVGDGARFELAIEYSEDGPQLLGTAGALRRALALLSPTFLVTYGDSLLDFDYASPLVDLEAHPEALGSMAVLHNQGQWDASNAEVRGQLVTRYEKGTTDAALAWIDYGATAFRREVIDSVPSALLTGLAGLDDVQSSLARAGRLRAVEVRDRFWEIGSERGLEELRRELRGKS